MRVRTFTGGGFAENGYLVTCDGSAVAVDPGAAADRMVAMPMDDVHWSDWGRPQRIADTLAKIGRSQSFPAEIVEESSQHAELSFASAA